MHPDLIETIERLYSADIREFGQPDFMAVQHGRVVRADSLGLLLEALAEEGDYEEGRRPQTMLPTAQIRLLEFAA